MIGRLLSRRTLVAILGGASAAVLAAADALARPIDQGIGGTGLQDDPDEPLRDRGIGGTGYSGTIRRFGSIYVNDVRIAYPGRVQVVIDDAPATPASLRIGHVVQAVAHRRRGVLSTNRIVVRSEVVGRIDEVSPNGLRVLGQTVATEEPASPWQVGDLVAVSGLRRVDGTIAASLIEPRPQARPRVTGLVTQNADGAPMIGELRLEGLQPGLVGLRCSVDGELASSDTLVVARARDVRALLVAGRPQRLSVEAFVQQQAGTLSLGSGLRVAGPVGAEPELAAETRAIVSLDVRRDGLLAVRAVTPDRASNRSGAAPSQDPGRPRNGPRGPGPGGPGGGFDGPGQTGPGGGGPGGPGPGSGGPGGGPGGGGPGGGPGGSRGGFGLGPGGAAAGATRGSSGPVAR